MHYRRKQRHGDANHDATVGRPPSAGMVAALNDLPVMGIAARARYAAAMNRKLRGEEKPGDDATLLNTGKRARYAQEFIVWMLPKDTTTRR
jgi:hypothetical protein